MSHHAQDERKALADLLERLGPDQPTLCEGWQTGDLAAHLVIRERRPDAAVGIAVPPLAARTERIQRRVRDTTSWADLVGTVRGGPPRWWRPTDEPFNTVEFFVHHEDVRRAQPGWVPRSVDPGLEAALWRRLKGIARLSARRVPTGLIFTAPGYGELTARKGTPTVTVSGDPGELVLFAFGRGDQARVEFSGEAAAVEQLRHARLGL